MSTVTPADVRSAILESLATELEQGGIDPAEVGDDLDLIERQIVDSLGFLELVAEIEERFGLELDFEHADPERISALGELAGLAAEQAAGAVGRR